MYMYVSIYPNQSNVDNLNNVRHEASRHCRNKKKEYMKVKIYELETNSNIYRGINDFKKGYQLRSNVVTDEKSDLVRQSRYFGYVEEQFLSATECT